MASLEQLEKSPNHWAGRYGPLLVVIWTHEVDAKVCVRMPAMARDVAAHQRDGRIAVLSVALPNTKAPSAEARNALASLVRDSSSQITRIAVVREGQGFIASTVSSIVVGIRMLAKSPVPHRSFSDFGEAVSWVTAELARVEWSPRHVDLAKESIIRKQNELIESTVSQESA